MREVVLPALPFPHCHRRASAPTRKFYQSREGRR